MLAEECMWGWNRNSSQVEVGPHPDTTRWSDKYELTGGACQARYGHFQTRQEVTDFLCREALRIIVGDYVDPQAVHKAFCKIDEYWQGLTPDMPK
jgi:hypothetical protein